MPIILYISILYSLISGKKRNLRADSKLLFESYTPKPMIKNADLIPANGPYLVTLNHYSRPGFFILWAAVAVIVALPKSSLWLMTGAWTDRTAGFDQLRTALTKKTFRKLAGMYGLVTMPPMPPVPEEVAERALSIRQLMQKLRKEPEAILCVAPEGLDFPDGQLGLPYPGTGKMLAQLAGILKRVLPVGVYEEGERLVINFGCPYQLPVPENLANLDMVVTRNVMSHIAELLPVEMRGLYQ